MNQFDTVNFTNIDKVDFVGMWNGETYTIKAGETKAFAHWLAQHFAKHLARKIAQDMGRDPLDEGLATEIKGRIFGAEAAKTVDLKKVVEESKAEEAKEGAIIEEAPHALTDKPTEEEESVVSESEVQATTDVVEDQEEGEGAFEGKPEE